MVSLLTSLAFFSSMACVMRASPRFDEEEIRFRPLRDFVCENDGAGFIAVAMLHSFQYEIGASL